MKPSNKPIFSKDFFYGKIKSPPFNLERFKESAQKAKETFKTGDRDRVESIVHKIFIREDLLGGANDIMALLSHAEQRGYERGLLEAHKHDPTGSELDDLLKRTEQEGYERGRRETK